MKIVSSLTLRNNLSNYLDEVEKYETPLVISRFGKAVAILKPYKKEEKSTIPFYNFLGKGLTGEKTLKRLRRSAKEKIRTKFFRT